MTARYRRGYTLFELIVVMAVLLLLAAIILPSLSAFRGDTRHRAAADTIRSELAVARARAMEEGRPYRVAISHPDGKRIRRGPDGIDFTQSAPFDGPSGSAAVVDYEFDYVTASVVSETDLQPEPTAGWITIATLLPDGTCREDTSLVVITEPDNGSLRVRVRGLTGSARVVPPDKEAK